MAWRRHLGLVVFLTLAACSSAPEEPPTVPSDPSIPGSNPSNPSNPGGGTGNSDSSDAGTGDSGTGAPSDAGLPSNDAGLPSNDAGIPSNDAGIPSNDAGIPSNDAGFAASLPPEACVPWTGSQPPQEASPCEETHRYSSGSTRNRYDPQGRLLERRTLAADGTLTRVETHAWSDGLETLSREENGDSSWWKETVSTFNAQRQLTTWIQRGSNDLMGDRAQYFYLNGRLDRVDRQHRYAADTSSFYVYTGERLERIEHKQGGEVTSITRYVYAGERLMSIDWEQSGQVMDSTRYTYDAEGRVKSETFLTDEGSYATHGESFTYHPNGRRQRVHSFNETSSTTETYDARGNRLSRDWDNHRESGGDRQSSDTWAYDEANRVTRSEHYSCSAGGSWRLLRQNSFNAQGQQELSWSLSETYTHSQPDEILKYSTTRSTYLCGTALPDHHDTDLDNDGTVDARCTYARDARGALLREECFRLPADPAYATSVDYRYDCQ